MIEINLLPHELRKIKKLPTIKIPNAKVIIYVVGAIFLVQILLIITTALNTKRLVALQGTWDGLSLKRTQLKDIREQLRQINAKIPLIEQLIRNRIIWSEKLNRLSDLIVSGVWLNELSLETEIAQDENKSLKYVLIRGSCASRSKDEPALIGKFMQNLKEDPSFSSDFMEIELGPIKKRLIGPTEVMDFTLICRFKQEKTQALLK